MLASRTAALYNSFHACAPRNFTSLFIENPRQEKVHKLYRRASHSVDTLAHSIRRGRLLRGQQEKQYWHHRDKSYSLPLYVETKIIATVSCTNQLTNRVLPQMSVELDYQNQAPLSASGGIIVSTLGQH
jgi:hypothetical protein